jgi:hypothetical protein
MNAWRIASRIPGTGGLRKFASGAAAAVNVAARAICYFYDASFPVLLVAIYAKNEKADLSAQEKKKFAAYAKEAVIQWRRR